MIYFVADKPGLEEHDPLVLECQLGGYEAIRFSNADEALEHLTTAKDIELILVHSLVSVNSDPSQSSFTRSETDNSDMMGLVLVRKLHDARPDLFPGKVVFLDGWNRGSSMVRHGSAYIEASIIDLEKDLGIKFIPTPNDPRDLFSPGNSSCIRDLLKKPEGSVPKVGALDFEC